MNLTYILQSCQVVLLFCVFSNIVTVDSQICNDIDLVSRAEWGARPPTEVIPFQGSVNMTFVHHTAGGQCFNIDDCAAIMRAIQDFHMGPERNWSDIAYTFLVGEDGRAYEGRGWGVVPDTPVFYNTMSYSVSIMGLFTDTLPNAAAMATTQALWECGVELGYITPDREMFGHRDAFCTECPGQALYEEIQTWSHYSDRDLPIYC